MSEVLKFTKTNIYEQSLESLVQLLRLKLPFKIFDAVSGRPRKLQVAWDNGDYLQNAIFQNTEKPIQYPYVGLIEGNTRRSTNRYSPYKTWSGIPAVLSANKSFWFVYSLTPVDVDIELVLVTDSIEHIREFKHFWLQNRPKSISRLVYDGYVIECGISFSDNVETGTLGLTDDQQAFGIRSGIILETFMGKVSKQTIVKGLKVDTEIINDITSIEYIIDEDTHKFEVEND